jgi:hypothetical protein
MVYWKSVERGEEKTRDDDDAREDMEYMNEGSKKTRKKLQTNDIRNDTVAFWF